MKRSDAVMVPVTGVVRGDRVAHPDVSSPYRVVTDVTRTDRSVTLTFVPVTGMPRHGVYVPDDYVPVRPR